MKLSYSRILAIGLVIGFIALAVLESMSADAHRLGTSTAFSARGSGISAFAELGSRAFGQGPLIRKEALLDAQQLEDQHSFLILGPQLGISLRESQILMDFVRSGGLLLISLEKKESLSHVGPLLHLLDSETEGKQKTLSLSVREDFENYKPTFASPSQSLPALFASPEQYAFYSNLKFDSPECEKDPFFCFVAYTSLGNGHIFFVSGLPPLANGLISLGDNWRLADRIYRDHSGVSIDEYRHLFAEKTFWDLISLASFSLPILGFLLLALLFFMFGRHRLDDVIDYEATKSAPISYHDFNEALLRGLLDRPVDTAEIALEQSRFLSQILPTKREEISAILKSRIGLSRDGGSDETYLALCRELVLEHQRYIRDKSQTTMQS